MARLRTPGWTRAIRASLLMSIIRLNLLRPSRMPSHERQGTTRQTGSRTTRNHRYLHLMTNTHDLLNLFYGIGQYRQHWQLPISRQAIALIGAQSFLFMIDCAGKNSASLLTNCLLSITVDLFWQKGYLFRHFYRLSSGCLQKNYVKSLPTA